MTSKTWKEYIFGHLIHIKHGFAFKGEYFGDSGKYIVLTPGNFHEHGGMKHKGDKEKYYTDMPPDEYVLNRGDLLVAMTDLTQNAPILGSPAFVPESGRFLHNQRLGKITVTRPDLVSPEFAFWLFNSYSVRSQIKGTASGATVRHTSPSRIYEVHAELPPPSTQRKIASILSAYDDLIENNTRRIAILKEMAQAIYREWFVKFRFPGHDNVKLVDSPLGMIPEGWDATNLGSVSENFDRLRKPLSKMQRADMQGPYPYYGAAKIFDYINGYIFDGKYLLIAEDGSVITPDRKPVLQLAYDKFWVNNHTHVLRGIAPVSTDFLFLALSDTDVSPYVTGAAQPKINQRNLNSIPMRVGDEELMQRFDEMVNPCIEGMRLLQRKNENLRTTRELLLPKLISGKLDVEELDIDMGEAIADLEETNAVSVEPTVNLASESNCQGTPQQIETDEPTPVDELESGQIMAEFRQEARKLGTTSRAELLKAVSRELGYKRLGSNIEEFLKGNLRAAIRRKIIGADGDEVWLETPSMDTYERDELIDTLCSVMRKRQEYEREEVIRSLANYLGFRRLTDSVREPIKSAINGAIRRDMLGYKGELIWRED